MERPNFVSHGVLRLPPGFRFHPTDEELVVQYLKRKVFSCPLPASIIPEIDLGKYDPWDLPLGGGSEEERYFFNLRESKYPNGNRSNRATGSGYWKATGKDKQVVASRCNQVVGMKKVLVFYQGKPPKGSRTDWIMHEYRLTSPETSPCILPQRMKSTHSSMVQTGDWVLCRIFKKKRATQTDVGNERYHNNIRVRNDRMQQNSDPGPYSSSSSSDSSCVTELSDASSNGEESSCNSISSSPCGGEP